jgi:hypothetical protein
VLVARGRFAWRPLCDHNKAGSERPRSPFQTNGGRWVLAVSTQLKYVLNEPPPHYMDITTCHITLMATSSSSKEQFRAAATVIRDGTHGHTLA